jgi:hypothetical protein
MTYESSNASNNPISSKEAVVIPRPIEVITGMQQVASLAIIAANQEPATSVPEATEPEIPPNIILGDN